MIIGIDGSEAFVKNRTGVENYAFYILKNLAKLDQTNTYVVYLDPRTNHLEGQWPENFKFKFLSWPIMWTQLGLAWQTCVDHLDLLFIPAHTLPILKNPFLKSIVTVHDLGAEYLGSLHQLKQRLYLRLMTKFQLKFATKIIAVSEATKKDIVKRTGIKPSKIEVIYEALIPFEKGENDVEVDILNRFDVEKKKYFLFVGTIQPRKNLGRLIEAFAQVLKQVQDDNFKLLLVGKKGWLADQIYELPKKLAIEDRVKFSGRLPDSDVQLLYKNALAFVYPSLFEGFGLPILEAFEYQCPVITSNVSSMPEVAGNGAILVDPYSVEEISRAMELLTIDNKFKQNLIKKAKIQLAKFSWPKAASQTLKLMEGLG